MFALPSFPGDQIIPPQYQLRPPIIIWSKGLFIGPKQIPAVLEDGLVVKKLYQIPDDHIVIELEYLYHLTDQALTAAAANDLERADAFLQRRNDFILTHLQKWAPAFAENILVATGENYFRGAACLLRAVVIGITQTALAEE